MDTNHQGFLGFMLVTRGVYDFSLLVWVLVVFVVVVVVYNAWGHSNSAGALQAMASNAMQQGSGQFLGHNSQNGG